MYAQTVSKAHSIVSKEGPSTMAIEATDFRRLYSDVRKLARHLYENGCPGDNYVRTLREYWGQEMALCIYLTARKFA